MYPKNWPECTCGEPVLDGHLTCGRASCDEAAARHRMRLAHSIADLAVAIEHGECRPGPGELEALAELCRRAGLPQEEARVRRWMGAHA